LERKTERLNLAVSSECAAKLRLLAADLGFIVGNGPYAGQGNVSGLVEAIGNGRVALGPSKEAISDYVKAEISADFEVETAKHRAEHEAELAEYEAKWKASTKLWRAELIDIARRNQDAWGSQGKVETFIDAITEKDDQDAE
jgi:hypothetical protein